jgi:hypothetical protein
MALRGAAADVLAVEDDFAVFGLSDSEATRAVYPFAFRLALAFRVTEARLHVAATVTNAGDHDMPFSFGYHPAFAWPLPGGAARKRIASFLPRMSPHPFAGSARRGRWCLKNRQRRWWDANWPCRPICSWKMR